MFSKDVQQLVDRFKDKLPNSNFKRWESSLYDCLASETNFLPAGTPIGQRLWHVEHNTTQQPTCYVCGGAVSWNRIKRNYRKFCSSKCSAATDEIKEKRAATMIERYGVANYTQSPDFNSKRCDTYKKKYGVDWSLQSPTIREQIAQTNLRKYGTKVYTQSKDYIEKNLDKLKSRGVISSSQLHIPQNVLEKLDNKDWLINEHHNKKKTITKISEELNVDKTTIVNRLNKFNVPLLRFSMSQGHRDIVESIQRCFDGEIMLNTREVLPSKKELDIFFPEKNLAIEYCGLYWHSADMHTRIGKDYHKDKFNECKNHGIKLLTIFEDEWLTKKDIVLSTIKHKLNLNQTKIAARKTTIQPISLQEARKFLDTYHIQGSGHGSIRIGILYENELVAVCVLIVHKNNNLILNRYATKYTVQGGFSKMLNYILKTYSPTSITTFADLRYSTGDIYANSGFTIDGYIKPDYAYVVNGQRKHKFGFRHSRLSKILKTYDFTKTEVENCLDAGLFRIWDCGKIRFKLVPDSSNN